MAIDEEKLEYLCELFERFGDVVLAEQKPSLMNNAEPIWLGKRAVIQPGAADIQLLRSDGASRRAEVCSIVLGFDFVEANDFPPAAGGSLRRSEVFARIRWGAGTSRFQAEVDFRPGTVVSIPAASADVEAFWTQGIDDDPMLRAEVSAGITAKPRGNRSVPTRTFSEITLAPAGTAVLRIPNFANESLLFGRAALPAGLLTRLTSGPAATDEIYSLVTGAEYEIAKTSSGGVPIPGHARFIQFENTTAGGVDFTPMFTIGL